MELIETYRKAAAEMTAKKLGRDAKQPRQFQTQMSASDFLSVIMALPVDTSNWQALQDETTGAMLFVSDGDPLDGGRPIG